MQLKRIPVLLMTSGVLLVVITGIWLATAQPVSAQCGSSASSCKNCHEVQGELPVNSDGTAWHQAHAFGDFCQFCHAGNNQSMEINEAHTGMVPPLSDIQASCQQCHPNDLEALAGEYAAVLGVTLGETTDGGVAPAATGGETGSETTSTGAAAITTGELDVDDPNLVDYEARYAEIVLGRRPVNWGNVILIGMIAMLAIGGGAFVLHNERLVKVEFGDTRPVEGKLPADIAAMLPLLAKMKQAARRKLQKALQQPARLAKALDLFTSDSKDH